MRDLLSWVSFLNVTEESLGSQYAFIHGAFLVVLDGLSLGNFLLLQLTHFGISDIFFFGLCKYLDYTILNLR